MLGNAHFGVLDVIRSLPIKQEKKSIYILTNWLRLTNWSLP